jgi:hypothetical protein
MASKTIPAKIASKAVFIRSLPSSVVLIAAIVCALPAQATAQTMTPEERSFLRTTHFSDGQNRAHSAERPRASGGLRGRPLQCRSITWGNGTSAPPESYGALLRYVASYGLFVVAANSREVGSGSPAPMLHALDFAAAANQDKTSPYYGKLDMTKVGAMGHSQGAAATASAASDPRILDIMLFNSGDTSSKPYLAVSGDTDITFYTPSAMAAAINASTVPAAWLYFHQIDVIGKSFSGHLTLQTQPQRVAEPAKDWWQMMLQNNVAAQSEFIGPNCGLCGDAGAQEFGEKNLP